MGGIFSSTNNTTAQIAGILQELERTRLEREIALAQLQERRRIAFKLAEEREKFNWIACGGSLVVVLSALSSFHHKNLLHVIPIFPMASFIGYKAHFCYGDQLKKISEASTQLLEDSVDNLVPLPPTIADVRNRRKQLKEEETNNY
uniref:Plasminogen receptor (KT) n=1 Tax=Caenorhabditis tropicalis TaxID=1561998 RepID=A0A1I7U3N6_9PELO